MAWKTSCSPGRSARSETDTNRITIGLTLRRTARKIRRLKGVVGGMCPSYSDSADPRFPDALGRKPTVAPRPMSKNEIRRAVAEFGTAAKNAIEAGFDGVQIQANYLYL